MSAANDPKTVAKLVADNEKLIYKVAKKYYVRTELNEDIEAAGMVGLIKAAKRYDPATGYKFSSIAVPWIRGEILHYLRDRGGQPKVPSNWRDIYTKGYGLSDEAAAAKCKITIEHWQQVKAACSTWLAEWDDKLDYGIEEPIDDDETEHPELMAAMKQVRQVLEALPDSELTALDEIFGASRQGKLRRELALQAIKRLL